MSAPDLRLLTGVGRPIPRLFPAPSVARPAPSVAEPAVISVPLWRQPPGPPAAGFGWGGQPGGWLHQGAELGQMPALPTVEELTTWWAGLSTQLYSAITNPALTARRLAGLDLPREVVDPVAARKYLADLLETMGALHGWPADQVAQYAVAMRKIDPAGTVVATVDRILSSTPPPKEWPGVDGWYRIALQIRSSAAYNGWGERLSLWQSAGLSAMQAARNLRAELVEQGQRITTSPGFWRWLEEAQEQASKAMLAVRTAAIAVPTGLAVGAGTILAGAALIYFGPELMAAGGVAKAATRPALEKARKYARERA